MHVLGLVDLVAERDRLLRAQPQQIARRQRADDEAGFVDDAEMADFQPAHAADGAIDEGVGRNGRERAAHELLDAELERALAFDRERAHHVALGDDAAANRPAAFPARRRAARPEARRCAPRISCDSASPSVRSAAMIFGGDDITSRMRWRYG